MRGLLLACIVACSMLPFSLAPTSAQQQPPVVVDKPDAPKAPEPKRAEREGSAAVSYTLAAIGTIIVMVLVCMPARRE